MIQSTAQSREVKSFLEFFVYKMYIFWEILNLSLQTMFQITIVLSFKKVVENSWVAMSIHKGEETFIIETVKKIKKKQIESQCIFDT